MSDGPYRSLPLSASWRRAGKEISQEASSLDDACERIESAVAQDFRDQGADEAIRLIRSALSDGAQSRLFQDQDQALQSAQEVCARSQINDAIFRYFDLARADGRSVEGALSDAVRQAVAEAGNAGLKEVREHWHACASKGEIKQSEAQFVERRTNEISQALAQSKLADDLLAYGGRLPKSAMRRQAPDRLEEGPPL